MKIMWETAVVFCLCSLSLVSSHSRKFTTPNVTRLTDQFSKIAIENGFSRRFGAHNIQVNGSLAKLTLDKSSGNKNLHCSVLNILFPRLFIFLMIKPEFLSVYYPQNLYICMWIFIYNIDIFAGAGLVSKNKYHYGFFSARLKLPAGFASGVVVAFYVRIICFIISW